MIFLDKGHGWSIYLFTYLFVCVCVCVCVYISSRMNDVLAGFRILSFFSFLAAPHGLWDLSSPTRAGSWALGSESTES